MKERPILFSGPMVQAILDGRKAQTRRVMKLQPSIQPNVYGPGEGVRGPKHADCTIANWPGESEFDVCDCHCPYGAPGDRLWVRESFVPDPPIDGSDPWAENDMGDIEWHGCGEPISGVPEAYRSPEHCIYRASWTGGELVWRPSIHMPRWASRITLEITGIRVERLQEISETDARWEGVGMVLADSFPPEMTKAIQRSRAEGFRMLWESINGAGSWEANPWVWVVEFRRVEA